LQYHIIPGRNQHNDSYVVVKLSHPKRKFSERNATKETKQRPQNLGYVKKRHYNRWSSNPISDPTENKQPSTALDIRLNEYFVEQVTVSTKLGSVKE
jgi:hypothetical protein